MQIPEFVALFALSNKCTLRPHPTGLDLRRMIRKGQTINDWLQDDRLIVAAGGQAFGEMHGLATESFPP